MSNLFDDMRERNVRRHKEWGGGDQVDISFRGLEFGGECGELQGAAKKIVRSLRNITGNGHAIEKYLENFKEEIGDVLITLDLLVMDVEAATGIKVDFYEAARLKFNATSEKNGMSTKWEK